MIGSDRSDFPLDKMTVRTLGRLRWGGWSDRAAQQKTWWGWDQLMAVG